MNVFVWSVYNHIHKDHMLKWMRDTVLLFDLFGIFFNIYLTSNFIYILVSDMHDYVHWATVLGFNVCVLLLAVYLYQHRHALLHNVMPRMTLFTIMGLFAAYTAVQVCGKTETEYACAVEQGTRGVAYVLLGVAFYVGEMPECFFPGYFDLVGSSHQIFHILATLCLYHEHELVKHLIGARLQVQSSLQAAARVPPAAPGTVLPPPRNTLSMLSLDLTDLVSVFLRHVSVVHYAVEWQVSGDAQRLGMSLKNMAHKQVQHDDLL